MSLNILRDAEHLPIQHVQTFAVLPTKTSLSQAIQLRHY